MASHEMMGPNFFNERRLVKAPFLGVGTALRKTALLSKSNGRSDFSFQQSVSLFGADNRNGNSG